MEQISHAMPLKPAPAKAADDATASPPEKRFDWVDVAKGFCIIMVVMMHSTLGVEKAVGETSWMGAIVEFARPFRMPDFFLISGLFLSRVIDRDWRSFLDRRVVHFLYFYLLWLTIQFAFKGPGMAMEEGVGAMLQAYLLAIFVEPFGTLWFIWMLPVFAVVVRLARNVPVPLMLLAGAILEIAPISTGHVAIDEFCERFVYFYAGYALASQIFAVAHWTGTHKKAALIALLVWAGVELAAVLSGWSAAPGISLALGVAGALAVIVFATLLVGVPHAGPALRFLGEHSIVVYLAFFLPMAVVRTALLKTGIISDIGLVSLITTVASVLVPLLIWHASRRLGWNFLFERPAWARLARERPIMGRSSASGASSA